MSPHGVIRQVFGKIGKRRRIHPPAVDVDLRVFEVRRQAEFHRVHLPGIPLPPGNGVQTADDDNIPLRCPHPQVVARHDAGFTVDPLVDDDLVALPSGTQGGGNRFVRLPDANPPLSPISRYRPNTEKQKYSSTEHVHPPYPVEPHPLKPSA